MELPLTRVLYKSFGKGFYRAHSGFLFFFFITFFIYFFFINVLNQTHLTPDERIIFNLSLVLAFLTNPVITGIGIFASILYSFKSCQYVRNQVTKPEFQFLFYSCTSLNKIKQFQSWFLIQLFILLPLILSGLFALSIGLIYNHYLVPTLVLGLVIVLTALPAVYHVHLVNRIYASAHPSFLFQITRKWTKPYFSLFLFQILNNQKITYLLTKIVSTFLLAGSLLFFSEVTQDGRVYGIIILLVVTAHAYLIYQDYQFTSFYLSFSRNFPFTSSKLFLWFIAVYSILFLPEFIFVLYQVKLIWSVGFILFGLSLALLFRSILFLIGLNISVYLRYIGGLFFVFQILVMAGFIWIMLPALVTISYLLLYKFYYR